MVTVTTPGCQRYRCAFRGLVLCTSGTQNHEKHKVFTSKKSVSSVAKTWFLMVLGALGTNLLSKHPTGCCWISLGELVSQVSLSFVVSDLVVNQNSGSQ